MANEKVKKIGINASFLRKGNVGIGQVTLSILKALREIHLGNDDFSNIQFFIYLEEDFEDLELPKNFKKRIFLPFWKRDDLIRKIIWEKILLPMKVKKDECDIFFTLYQNPTILCGKRTKHIMIVHDLIPKLFPEYLDNIRKKIYWWLTEKGIKKADQIICVSKNTQEDVKKYLEIEEGKISIIYPSIDDIYEKKVDSEETKRVLKKYGLKKEYLYYGGGLEVRKNVEFLIKAYKRMLEKSEGSVPDLVISSKLIPELAPLITDVEKIIKKLKLENKVKALDFVPQEDLPHVYKGAKLFIYPSIYEGFGLPVLEAMKLGVPVLTSDNASLPEVGGDAVEYFDPNDENALVEKIEELIANDEKRMEIASKGKRRSEEFSWKIFVKKMLDLAKE